MPIINSKINPNSNLILVLRILPGLVWLGTAFRRILIPNFEQRISEMAVGDPIIPTSIMEFAVNNWKIIFIIVLGIEIISSISLLTGTFARGGAFLATINGFGIGMAGLGLGVIDLVVPWLVAVITLVLFLFTHPGMYKGMDAKLKKNNFPSWLKSLM
ncbi:MAG: hypothetical protein ACW98F_14575 [Candidatus Hodarchaeales archaeon]|jgi:uncharacterized membrane protein